MTTVYQTPGACSLAPLIALHAANLPHDTILVDVRVHKLSDGSDYLAVNPKGSVPSMRTADGEILTEVSVLLQFISDLAPGAGLIPSGGVQRYRQLELMNFVATEIHKGFPPPKVFFPDFPVDAWNFAAERFRKKLAYVSEVLGDRPYLTGDKLTAADAYLYTILRSVVRYNFDISAWPALVSYVDRLPDHPAIKAALAEEGLGE